MQITQMDILQRENLPYKSEESVQASNTRPDSHSVLFPLYDASDFQIPQEYEPSLSVDRR